MPRLDRFEEARGDRGAARRCASAGTRRARLCAAATRTAAALLLGGLIAGCASNPIDSARSFASVTPLPKAVAQQGQSARDQEWDFKDCQAEAGYRTNYSPTDSPMANLFRNVFFWGTAGASLGGVVDGFPTIVDASTPSTGLIVGASTGGAVGVVTSWKGQTRFERAWAACMESRGYGLVPP
jgi:hypothetical protein